jgi:hypothetical protein
LGFAIYFFGIDGGFTLAKEVYSTKFTKFEEQTLGTDPVISALGAGAIVGMMVLFAVVVIGILVKAFLGDKTAFQFQVGVVSTYGIGALLNAGAAWVPTMAGFPLLPEGDENASYKYNYNPLTVVSKLMDVGKAFGIVFPLFMLMQSVLVGLANNDSKTTSEFQFYAKVGTALGRCIVVLFGETFAEAFEVSLAKQKTQIRFRAGCLVSSYSLSAIGLFIIGWVYTGQLNWGKWRYPYAFASLVGLVYVLSQLSSKDLEDPEDGCQGCKEDLEEL